MTVSRARRMYTDGSWTVPQAKGYLERRYSKGRLAAELIDQWELHNWWMREYRATMHPAPNSGIPREDLIALISTAYECKGITRAEAARLFRLLELSVRESRSHLKMIEDSAMIVAIFGAPKDYSCEEKDCVECADPDCADEAPPRTMSTKAAILDRLADLMDDPPPDPRPDDQNRRQADDGPTYPNCNATCPECSNDHCKMWCEN